MVSDLMYGPPRMLKRWSQHAWLLISTFLSGERFEMMLTCWCVMLWMSLMRSINSCSGSLRSLAHRRRRRMPLVVSALNVSCESTIPALPKLKKRKGKGREGMRGEGKEREGKERKG